MRALIASTELAGHFGPLIPFVESLIQREDEVLIVGPPGLAKAAKATGCRFEAGALAPAGELAQLWQRARAASPKEAAVLVNREIFGRLNTAAMLPTMERVCDRWAPDLVLREPCEYASAIAAERGGIPHAQVAISLAGVEEGSLRLAAPVLTPYLDRTVERLIASPYLTRFPSSLDPSPFPSTIRFREPSYGFREPPRAPRRSLPEWWGEDDRPLIYATLGSLAGGRPETRSAYGNLVEALSPLPMRVLLTTGNDFDDALLPALSPNIHVEPWVPQADVLPHAALVVCHGGSGTTFGALAAGVPLVILPLFADQPVNAQLVAAAGAGIAVAQGSAGSRLREAIEAVLADPSYERAAEAIAREMRSTPEIGAAIDALLASAGFGALRTASEAAPDL